jgi:hypothetical protein
MTKALRFAKTKGLAGTAASANLDFAASTSALALLASASFAFAAATSFSFCCPSSNGLRQMG